MIVRREEHAETLLTFATSARSKSKAMENLLAYEQFWHAFAFLCHRFSSVVEDESKELYSWLIQPMAAQKVYANANMIEAPGASGGGGDVIGGGISGGGSGGKQQEQRDFEMR